MPVLQRPGTTVYAGSVNGDGALEIRASCVAADSILSKVVRLVHEAEERRAPSEKLVRRFARVYTPVVTIAAVVVALAPALLFGEPIDVWVVRGLTLLVIACPCALVISTPVAVISAITAAARHGVLIKGGDHLETLGRVRALAVDKTGTLTRGRPALTEVVPLNGHTIEEMLPIAAALESQSAHPIAQAIVAAAGDADLPTPTEFRSVAGRGVSGTVNGVAYRLGTPEMVSLPLPQDAVWTEGQPQTTVLLSTETELVGVFAVTDPVRDGAAQAIAALRHHGVERVVMLTGDNRATAEAVGSQVGVDEVHAGLLPEQKVEAVGELRRRYGVVAFVGDGVNDAPALATASVGVAMGSSATNVALETADVALLDADLARLPQLFSLARRSYRVIRQNIALSIVVKASLAAGVVPGLVSLVVAVLVGDMGTSLAVIANAMRLARMRTT